MESAGAVPAAVLLDLDAVRCDVEAVLTDFFRAKERAAREAGLSGAPVRVLADFVGAGGKRLRPLLCAAGWCAAAGGEAVPPEAVLKVAAALEMFHAFALVHDDVMDGSPARRGRPSVHRTLAGLHPGPGPLAAEFGRAAAVLIGDMAFAFSDELVHTAGLSPQELARVLPLLGAMRIETMHGQWLDLLTTGRPSGDVETARTVIAHKTAKYTVERPLHIGAALAGPASAVQAACSAYALPLGEAFQLRDDLLGVFGTARATGKDPLDDLREGKNTVLLATARQRADPAQRSVLRALVGKRDLTEPEAARIRTVIEATGARADVERMIARLRRDALRALAEASFPAAAAGALHDLAHAVVARTG
ncbi:polyprenyl synthetase family protein [Streptomyces sp. NPDC093094]|uniref:polyprenyl synthetase family protein n=1 Tax=Streptomyces sp. NPDC093094 TaxID=3366026 RepID=UPI0038135188